MSATTPAQSVPGDAPSDRSATQAVDVLVVVGTDHHKFDRVVRWIDEWVAGRPGVSAMVQYGTSVPPVRAAGSSLVAHSQLQILMRDAQVVVSHGGPATITEIRRIGKLPLVVPRDPALGEHIDGHQQRFSRRMGSSGFVVLCETRDALFEALDDAIANPSAYRVTAEGEAHRIASTVAEYGRILDSVIAASRH